MAILQNKIDFVALVRVEYANPNGDPQEGNRPRTNLDGYGLMSDCCIKRKIRNRLQDMGEKIFLQSDDRCDDGFASLADRATWNIPKYESREDYANQACSLWADVRAFGQVFAYKGKKTENVSVPVHGPITFFPAISCSPVDVVAMQITKSVNGESTPTGKKSSDTMGTRYYVPFGLYKIRGSICVQPAEKNGLTEKDVDNVKEALRTLFENDASSARPEGSMSIAGLYWWKHNNKTGQYPTVKVHDSVKVTLKDGVTIPKSMDDYEITVEELDGLPCEVLV